MARKKGRVKKREILPDPKYGSWLVQKMINKVMWDGKKSIAEKIVYKAMEILEQKTKKPALEVFEKAIENVKPKVELKPRRVGGATYQIPVEIREERQLSLALKWIVNFARAKKGKPMYLKLAQELLDAYNNTGASIKKRDETHKMAEANRAFAHLRW
ncbi:30S ribosomal protein S7 [Methanosarcinales archaeon]|nr:MAG: 30S ribosomal protein S7 [Methanosarcinales archaeon]